jgi:long-chain acyl-CoA synthetase
MGFAVIQGYGLTETAPIVTLNHPFKTSKGSVGTPIAGVEIASRGRRDPRARRERHERLLRPRPTGVLAQDGWLHTGDIGERDAEGGCSSRAARRK